MAARLGHSVLGIDTSQTGIRQMLEEAEKGGLKVRGVVADLSSYEVEGEFDVVVLDRVLHMLEENDRVSVLQRALRVVAADGVVLIADMPGNKPAFRKAFLDNSHGWISVLNQKGFLFMRRQSQDVQPSPGRD